MSRCCLRDGSCGASRRRFQVDAGRLKQCGGAFQRALGLEQLAMVGGRIDLRDQLAGPYIGPLTRDVPPGRPLTWALITTPCQGCAAPRASIETGTSHRRDLGDDGDGNGEALAALARQRLVERSSTATIPIRTRPNRAKPHRNRLGDAIQQPFAYALAGRSLHAQATRGR